MKKIVNDLMQEYIEKQIEQYKEYIDEYREVDYSQVELPDLDLSLLKKVHVDRHGQGMNLYFPMIQPLWIEHRKVMLEAGWEGGKGTTYDWGLTFYSYKKEDMNVDLNYKNSYEETTCFKKVISKEEKTVVEEVVEWVCPEGITEQVITREVEANA